MIKKMWGYTGNFVWRQGGYWLLLIEHGWILS